MVKCLVVICLTIISIILAKCKHLNVAKDVPELAKVKSMQAIFAQYCFATRNHLLNYIDKK